MLAEGGNYMNRFGGFGGGGGMGGMQNLMRQAQKMQEDMQRIKEEINNSEFVGTAGGMVTVTLFGTKAVKSVDIKKEAIDPDDKEMLEDLIAAAFNDATKKIEKEEKEKLPNMGGMGI